MYSMHFHTNIDGWVGGAGAWSEYACSVSNSRVWVTTTLCSCSASLLGCSVKGLGEAIVSYLGYRDDKPPTEKKKT